MPIYPFQPEILDVLPEELVELFRGLEDTLITEICSRLKLRDKLNEVTMRDIKALRSHGVDLKEIKRQYARPQVSVRKSLMTCWLTWWRETSPITRS